MIVSVRRAAVRGRPRARAIPRARPITTTFWETARVASFPQSFATQSSSLKFNSMAAYGTLEAASDLVPVTPPHFWLLTSSSLSNSFSTSFDVDEATPYRLTGSVTATGELVWATRRPASRSRPRADR